MNKETNNVKELAQQFAEILRDAFDNNTDTFEIHVVTDGNEFTIRNVPNENEPQEEFKKEKELTLGEKYVLFLLNGKHIPEDNVTFDAVINTIIDNPFNDFMVAMLDDATKTSFLAYVSQLTESLINVDFSKLRKM